MHELSIAQRIIERIEEEARKNGFSKVSRAEFKIGKMAAFQKDQLEFCLSTYEKNEILEGMKFKIEDVSVLLQCNNCGIKFIDERFDDHDFAHTIAHVPSLYLPPPCSSCKSDNIKMIAGNEMNLVSIEGE